MRTSRSLLLFIFVVLLIVGLVPFINGWFFKQKYLELLSSLNTDSEIQFRVKEYHLGWRHSTALVDVIIPSPVPQNEAMHFTLEQHIQHGPLIFKENFPVDTHFQYAFIDGILKKDSRVYMNLTTNVSFGGIFQNHFDILNVDLQLPFATKLTWEGANGTMDFKADQNHIEYGLVHADIYPIVLKSMMGSVNITKINFQNEFHYENQHTLNGTNTLKIPGINLDFLQFDIRIGNLQLDHSFDVKNNAYQSKVSIGLQQLSVPNLMIAPLNATFALSNFNFDAFLNFIKNSENDNSPELFYKSITPQSQLNSTIDFSIPEGNFHADFKGNWSDKAFPQKPDFFNYMDYDIKIVAAKTLVHHLIELASESSPQTVQPQAKPLTFDDQVNVLVEQKLMSIYAASQVKELVKTPLPMDAFETALQSLQTTNEITPEAVNILKQSYATLQAMDSQPQIAQPTAEEALSAKFDELIKQGYILQEKDNYVVNITHHDGAVLINGRPQVLPSGVDVGTFISSP
jgi:hypothetical protein